MTVNSCSTGGSGILNDFLKKKVENAIEGIDDLVIKLYLQEKVDDLRYVIDQDQDVSFVSPERAAKSYESVTGYWMKQEVDKAQHDLLKALKIYAKKNESTAATVKEIAIELLKDQANIGKKCKFVEENLLAFQKLASIVGPANECSLKVAEHKAKKAVEIMTKTANQIFTVGIFMTLNEGKTPKKTFDAEFVGKKIFLDTEEKVRNYLNITKELNVKPDPSVQEGLEKAQNGIIQNLKDVLNENKVLGSNIFSDIILYQSRDSVYISSIKDSITSLL